MISDLGSGSVFLCQIVGGRIKCTRGELSKFLQMGWGEGEGRGLFLGHSLIIIK